MATLMRRTLTRTGADLQEPETDRASGRLGKVGVGEPDATQSAEEARRPSRQTTVAIGWRARRLASGDSRVRAESLSQQLCLIEDPGAFAPLNGRRRPSHIAWIRDLPKPGILPQSGSLRGQKQVRTTLEGQPAPRDRSLSGSSLTAAPRTEFLGLSPSSSAGAAGGTNQVAFESAAWRRNQHIN